MKTYIRQPLYDKLWRQLVDKINLLQVVMGPRQVGKTTLALQVLEDWRGPKLYGSADQPDTPSKEWLIEQWGIIRRKQQSKRTKALLILDEVQKIPRWSEAVKKLFDEDQRFNRNIRIVLLGSSALLMQRGLTESLAGRFEIHRHHQWTYGESREAFRTSLNQFLFYGGYPKALLMRHDERRWGEYIRDALIETVLSKDIMLMSPIAKPALLRQSFGLAMDYPAQIVSYQKMLGSLQDAGNTTTIASYLQLLSKAFLIAPLERWRGIKISQRASTPKLIILDNGLLFAMKGLRYQSTVKNKTLWGRCVENAVGAKLYFTSQTMGGDLYYWRDRQDEVDFVLRLGDRIIAIEVKSGIPNKAPAALKHFLKRYKTSEPVVISGGNPTQPGGFHHISLKDFFCDPVERLFQ